MSTSLPPPLPSILTTTKTVVSSASTASSTVRAAPQGGVLEGLVPNRYDAKNPIVMFIIQAGIIIIFCRLLHYPLSKLRQPRVIAEVIGGIILGPSVMMRIPGFQAAIFPSASMPNLNLVANLGLILFLFLVGLEVNMRMFLANWKIALSVGLAGMALPFALGCAIAKGLYDQFHHDAGTVPISFGVYMLFVGTALSITAFPVLCRILTELKLLGTTVGVTVLAAGVGNDVIGWILLALCVALVNNGSGLSALYVLLCCIGWILFLVYLIRPCFVWILRRSGSLQNGPTQAMVALTLLLALTSAWFTGIIGVHPIFGAFLVGLICPHDGGFAIKLTEKIEDIVSVLFLPLYFALSGLSTNIGLLNNGMTWAYTVGVIVVAFSGKIIGGTLAAKANKLVWRESLSIGVLMSCKGLVELIVLNIGLQAKILSTRTFTIFVVMALVTTVSTTPLISYLYPPAYQKKLDAWKRGEIDWEGNPLHPEGSVGSGEGSMEKLQNTEVRKLLVYLRLDSLPSLFTFITLLVGDRPAPPVKIHQAKRDLAPVPEDDDPSTASTTPPTRRLEVHGLRMLELTERTSSVMKVSELEEHTYRDPVVNAFRTFAQLNSVAVSGGVSVVPENSYAQTLTSQAADHSSDLILIPWTENGSIMEGEVGQESFSAGFQDAFIQKTLETASCNTAIFVNRGFGGPALSSPRNAGLVRTTSGLSLRSHREAVISPIADRSHHIFFPFFGGADDRVALRFVLQLARSTNVTATIVHFITSSSSSQNAPEVAVPEAVANPSSPRITHTRSASSDRGAKNASTTAAAAAATTAVEDTALIHTLRDSLPEALSNRVVFVDVQTTAPMRDCVEYAKQEVGQSPRNAGDLVVVGRGTGRMGRFGGGEGEGEGGAGSGSGAGEREREREREGRKSLGVVAEGILGSGARGSLLVIQAGEGLGGRGGYN